MRYFVMLFAAMFLMVGCAKKGHKAKQEKKHVAAVKTEAKQEAKKETKKEDTAKKEQKSKIKTEAVKTPGIIDKKVLEKCYLEVYCAQKRGDMSKILDIYKKYGFQTPAQWTRAWLEAAKDRDWVSEVARKASKACKK